MGHDWKYGTFDCFAAPAVCLWAWCIPGGSTWMQVMSVNNVTDDKDAGLKAFCCLYWCAYFGAAYNRMTIRDKLDIKGNYCVDLLCYCFCGVCSNVQEYRHVMQEKHNDHKRPPWQAK